MDTGLSLGTSVFMDARLRGHDVNKPSLDWSLPSRHDPCVQGYVYILASRRHGTLYIGVTSDLVRRVYEHRTHAAPGFTSEHDVHRLVWFEVHDTITDAIVREKQLKKRRRGWKARLIEEKNPEWIDLYESLTR